MYGMYSSTIHTMHKMSEPTKRPRPIPPFLTGDPPSGKSASSEAEPDEPQEVRLRRMRELMWGPVSDEEYAHRLKFGSGRFGKIKVTPTRKPIKSMRKLKAARKKVQQLGEVVRSEAFDDWVANSVVRAERPDDWTRARELYESYIRHAGKYGNNRADKRLSTEELATETAWGKMMVSLYPNKKRRARGWYYPIRIKKGA